MADVGRLNRKDARRIAVRAQLLDADRPPDQMTVINRLTFLQLDPTAVVAPSADLVTWSRVGNAYDPTQMQHSLEVDRTMFEHRGQDSAVDQIVVVVRPMAHLGLYLADMEAWPFGSTRTAKWMADNDAFRRNVLDLLRTSGPLLSRDIPDTAAVPWASSGWTNDRSVTQLLEFLTSNGDVAVSGRRGRHRLWDLAERVYPANVTVVPRDEARRIRDENRLRSLGIARPRMVGDAGTPVEVEGTKGVWRVDPQATAGGFEGRTALLSPFDRLIHNRARTVDLFDFEYTLEMYKPQAKRRWGYFALPILHHDQLIGKVDAAADRSASVLQVHALHEDVPFTRAMTAGVNAELNALASWLGLDAVRHD